MAMNREVIYLTGAPGVGKSTLSEALRTHRTDVTLFEYGAQMAAHLRGRGVSTSQSELRQGVSGTVSLEDIDSVNRQLLAATRHSAQGEHLVIDTHQVTAEAYGLEAQPFAPSFLDRLGLTQVWLLTLEERIRTSRVARAPGGRRDQSGHLHLLHSAIQASLATCYAQQLGVPLRVLDGDQAIEDLLARVEPFL